MGADVMRWQYCAQPPDQQPALRLRAGAGDQARAADALELGLVLRRRTRTSRASARPRRPRRWRRGELAAARPLARRADAARSSPRRPRRTSDSCTVERDRAFEAYVDDLSNWYIRRSRRRFWTRRRGGAPDALVRARADAARDGADDAVPHRAPVAEPRARAAPRVGAPRAAGRSRASRTVRCSTEIADVRRVVDARPPGARRGRAEAAPAAAAAGRRGRAAGARRTRRRSRDEVRVKEVVFETVEARSCA